MTQKEKRKFINDVLLSLKLDTFNEIHRMPGTWDGIELRWYLERKLQGADFTLPNLRKRRKEFLSDLIVNGL